MDKKEINELLEKNIITSEIADSIFKYNEINTEEKNKLSAEKRKKRESDSKDRMGMVINIIASIFLAFGAIWIIAANWSFFSRLLSDDGKVVLMILLTLASLVYVFYCKKKEKYKMLEFASIIYTGLSIGNISLISQVYNMQGDIRIFLLLCLVIIASIGLCANSKILQYLFLISATMYVFFYKSFFAWNLIKGNSYLIKVFYLLSSLIVIGISLLNLISNILEEKNKVDLKNIINEENKNNKIDIVQYVKDKIRKNKFTGKIIFFSYLLLGGFGDLSLCPRICSVFFVLLAYFTCEYLNRYKLRNFFKWLFVLFVFVNTFDFDMYQSDNQIGVVIWLIITMIYAFYLFYIGKFKDNKKNELNGNEINSKELNYSELINKKPMVTDIVINEFIIYGSLLNALLSLIYVFSNYYFEGFNFVFMGFMFIYSIRFIIKGINNLSQKLFYTGEIMFITIVIRFFFSVDMDFMIRGIISIVLGIAMLIYNKIIGKKIKADISKKEIVNEEVNKENQFEKENEEDTLNSYFVNNVNNINAINDMNYYENNNVESEDK